MNAVQTKVINEASVIDDHILIVDSFLNHQMDPSFMNEIGQLFYNYFKNHQITRILTCEASGIGIAIMVASYFKVPMVFAKKNQSLNLNNDVYQSSVFSYTKQIKTTFNVKKEFIKENDWVLIIDDFLANGQAVLGLIDIVKQAKAHVSGIGIVIEKGFQEGGQILRELGYDLVSLCIVDGFDNGNIQVRK